ncbi:MAG: tetratricopeptide repeat protein, partial [Pseudomonadota bacterium]
LARIRLAQQSDDHDEALAICQAAHDRLPASAGVLSFLMGMLNVLDRPEEVVSLHIAASPRLRTGVEIQLHCAAAHQNLGDLAQADQIYADLVNKNPSDRKALLARADFLERTGRAEEAVDLLDKSVGGVA